ncbi:divalent-cation tolerance protein CutA [Archaeoglobales archaeon]|nr:MAG: divalent-cation tolerance protein CutA [Archaeoglobales archaeon]
MHNFVYITAPTKKDAEELARKILERRLAACVNIFKIKSLYIWEGKIEESDEYGMIVKTRAEKFAELREEVRKLHKYSTPCICAIPIERGLKEFLDWIDELVG